MLFQKTCIITSLCIFDEQIRDYLDGSGLSFATNGSILSTFHGQDTSHLVHSAGVRKQNYTNVTTIRRVNSMFIIHLICPPLCLLIDVCEGLQLSHHKKNRCSVFGTGQGQRCDSGRVVSSSCEFPTGTKDTHVGQQKIQLLLLLHTAVKVHLLHTSRWILWSRMFEFSFFSIYFCGICLSKCLL